MKNVLRPQQTLQENHSQSTAKTTVKKHHTKTTKNISLFSHPQVFFFKIQNKHPKHTHTHKLTPFFPKSKPSLPVLAVRLHPKKDAKTEAEAGNDDGCAARERTATRTTSEGGGSRRSRTVAWARGEGGVGMGRFCRGRFSMSRLASWWNWSGTYLPGVLFKIKFNW